MRELIDTADTPGGHIIIALFIGVVGVIVSIIAVWTGHDKVASIAEPMTQFLAVAAYAMRGTDKATARVTEDSVKHTAAPEQKEEEKKP